jgi:hypothetical protein
MAQLRDAIAEGPEAVRALRDEVSRWHLPPGKTPGTAPEPD